MEPLAWHVTMRRSVDRVIAPGAEQRRKLVDVCLQIGRDHGLFLLGAPDTHVHTAVETDRRDAGRFARDLETALCKHLDLGAGWAPAHFTPVEDQRHLRSLRSYILGNGRHHGSTDDPWLEGTNLPDLLGARLNGAYTAGRLRALLPRTTRALLLDLAGLDDLVDLPDPDRLVDAAAAALGLPRLEGRGNAVLRARRAVIAVGESLGLSGATLAEMLALDRRSVLRLRASAPDPVLSRAIGLQCDLRRRLGPADADFTGLLAEPPLPWLLPTPALTTA